MNVTDLIERVRDILGEQPQTATQPRHWTDTEILRAINSGYTTLWNTAHQADELWGLDFILVSSLGGITSDVAGNMTAVVFPEDLGTIVYVEEGVEAAVDGLEVVPAGLRDLWRHKAQGWPYNSGSRGWFLAASGSGIVFTKTGTTLDLTKTRIWFIRKAPHLVRFVAATYPTTSSIRVNVVTPNALQLGKLSVVKDYYKNARVECIAAPTPGNSPQRLTFVSSGWAIQAHPNFDMTLAVAHGLGAVANGTWEVLPLFPEEHHELIAQYGAYRALAKGADQAQRVNVKDDVGVLFTQFVEGVEQRQIQRPRYVNVED